MSLVGLPALAAIVHKNNAKWWVDLETGAPLTRNRGELLMLMISEISEAMEGERRSLMDDKLPHRPMAEVEMADLVTRALDYAAGLGYADLLNDAGAELVWRYTFWQELTWDSNRAEALLQLTRQVDAIYALEIDGVSRDYRKGIATHLSLLIAAAARYCKVFGYDLDGAFDEKQSFNATRADHQPEARKAKGGKKW